MKKEKGITLVALIITIIVMLILVGVTISVALNGGLFDKAKNAAALTQKESDKEELMSVAFGTVDRRGNLNITKSELEDKLSDGWNVGEAETDSTGDAYFRCTKKDTVLYIYAETGKIVEEEPSHVPQPKTISIAQESAMIHGSDKILEYDETKDLSITVTGIDSSKQCEWSTDSNLITLIGNNRTATIEPTGTGTGQATITVTCDGETATFTVTIVDRILSGKQFSTYYKNDGTIQQMVAMKNIDCENNKLTIFNVDEETGNMYFSEESFDGYDPINKVISVEEGMDIQLNFVDDKNIYFSLGGDLYFSNGGEGVTPLDGYSYMIGEQRYYFKTIQATVGNDEQSLAKNVGVMETPNTGELYYYIIKENGTEKLYLGDYSYDLKKDGDDYIGFAKDIEGKEFIGLIPPSSEP